MKKITKIVICLIGVMILFTPFGISKETITWIRTDFPPMWIIKGKFKKQGINDLTLKLLIKSMKGYKHKMSTGNTSRRNKTLKNSQSACGLGMLATSARKKFAYFSISHIVVPTQSLFTTRKKSKLFISLLDNGDISLKNLLKNQNLKLGIARDRSYGRNLDLVITKHKNQKILYFGQERI